jgi:uncharacterized protein
MTEHKYTNSLISETSPYLLQHAHNPVDWYSWSEEALQIAREKDIPILLSIGYSSCHWCHVMERESFENEKIAKLMNENFICIKVDREERPDLDDIYMNAVQAMTGSGGWPMTVFLAPNLKPFYAGTYFPPMDIYGRPGFVTVLLSISKFYREHKDKVKAHSDQIVSVMQDMSEFKVSEESLSADVLDFLYNQSVSIYDPDYGGFGNAPKFPQPTLLSFLMRYWKRKGESHALEMVDNSLKKMANGGIYDHLGGGFHRYSVDERWFAPHFEKMLYDNALLSKVYLEAYQITGNDLYRRVVEETLDYVIREMYRSDGGFYSAQDADSEGEEGKYYVWNLDEVKKILDENTDIFVRYYNLTAEGNFEHGKNILYIADSNQESSDILPECKNLLFEHREKRVKPGLDDKILTSWNALMISSMAFGYQVLGNEKYLDVACKTADFILSELSKDGKLLRTYRNGIGKLNAYAEDYAFFINALIDLYEATFDVKWLKEGVRLNSIFISEFWDDEKGGFFYTGKSHESLIVRPKSFHDGAIPSANSIAGMNLLRLAKFTGDDKLIEKAGTIFRLFMDQIQQAPVGFSQMLCVLDFYLGSVKEIVVIGKREDTETKKAIQMLYDRYIPNKILVFSEPDNEKGIEDEIPLLKGRINKENQTIVYICEDNTCKNPIKNMSDLTNFL